MQRILEPGEVVSKVWGKGKPKPHRLSTIRHCDRILVLDGGQIIEDGSYEELIEKNGFFAELVERQQLNAVPQPMA